jgi:hypothetical protein
MIQNALDKRENKKFLFRRVADEGDVDAPSGQICVRIGVLCKAAAHQGGFVELQGGEIKRCLGGEASVLTPMNVPMRQDPETCRHARSPPPK